MIKIFKKVEEVEKWRCEISTSLGLVPTMGNLHDGHLSLVKKSLSENDNTIVTIFVNPKQFSPNEDFASYPRTVENDVEKLSSLLTEHDESQLFIFIPQSENEIYPTDFNNQIIVKHPMTKVLCGAYRDGHFDGVTTVVYRLFEITKPTISYFGEKDFQQLTIIKEMVKQQKLTVKISSLPIVRDRNGLALSSRNQYLSSEEKEIALTLSKTLIKLAANLSSKNYEKTIAAKNLIIQNDSHWQYLEVLDSETLSKPNIHTKNIVIAGAYIMGKTRLIDNITTKYS